MEEAVYKVYMLSAIAQKDGKETDAKGPLNIVVKSLVGTNGQCESTPTGFKCNCFEGWGGQRCNENINECQNITCLNGGSCIDHINRYNCTCTGDWYGTHCETLKSSCDDVHCENYGVCVDT